MTASWPGPGRWRLNGPSWPGPHWRGACWARCRAGCARARAAHLAKALVRDVQRTSRLAARVRRDHVRLDLPDSVFCAVRDRQTQPLCGFYVAAAAETMRHIGVPVVGRIDDCRALGARSCVMTMTFHGATAADPALAA